MVKKYLLHIPNDIYKALKHVAIDEDTSMKEIILTAIEMYLKQK